jgi:hypothetical protein
VKRTEVDHQRIGFKFVNGFVSSCLDSSVAARGCNDSFRSVVKLLLKFTQVDTVTLMYRYSRAYLVLVKKFGVFLLLGASVRTCNDIFDVSVNPAAAAEF